MNSLQLGHSLGMPAFLFGICTNRSNVFADYVDRGNVSRSAAAEGTLFRALLGGGNEWHKQWKLSVRTVDPSTDFTVFECFGLLSTRIYRWHQPTPPASAEVSARRTGVAPTDQPVVVSKRWC